MMSKRRYCLCCMIFLAPAILNVISFAASPDDAGTSSSKTKVTIVSSRVFRDIDPNDAQHQNYLAQLIKVRPTRDQFELTPTTVSLNTSLMRIKDGLFQVLMLSNHSVKRSYKYLQASVDNRGWLHLDVHRDLNYQAPADCIEHGRIKTAKLYEDHGLESFEGWMRVRIPPNKQFCLIDVNSGEGSGGLEVVDHEGTISFKQPERTEYEEFFLLENSYLLFHKHFNKEQFDMLLFDSQGILADKKMFPGASGFRLEKDVASEHGFFLQWAPASVARFEISERRIEEKWAWHGMSPSRGMGGSQYSRAFTIWPSLNAQRIMIAARKRNGYPPEMGHPGTFIFLDRTGTIISEKDHDGWSLRGFVSENIFVYQTFARNGGPVLEDGKFNVYFADCRTQETVFKYPVKLSDPPKFIGLNVMGNVIDVFFSRPVLGRNIPNLDAEVIQVSVEENEKGSGM